MEIRIVKAPIPASELRAFLRSEFGTIVKAVVDVEQGIMAIGGELHADEEVLLCREEGSKREHAWGINLHPDAAPDAFIEFDSMVNLKPAFGNRSRGVDDPELRNKIRAVVARLIVG